MKLLIDGDVLAYRAGFATEKTKYLVVNEDMGNIAIAKFDDAKSAKDSAPEGSGHVVWSRKELEPEDKALMLVDVMIGDIRARFASEGLDTHLYLSGVGNYRNGIATRATYKGNRSGAPVPRHFNAIRNHLVSKWKAEVSAGEEADDLIGIAATSNPGSIVCSIDKDLMQLPGKHYDFAKKEETTVNHKQAVLNFYAQVLSGDPVDNVPGLTGVGPVKARKALADAKSPSECWDICLKMYGAEFGELGREYAVESARLVYVRKKVGETWWPPSEAKTTETQSAPKASRKGRVPKRVGSGDSEGSNREGDQV